jgi:hypothetical protein
VYGLIVHQTLMALRAFGILLAIWLVLGGIAFIAGVLPTFGPEAATTNASGNGDEDGDEDGDGASDDNGDEEGDDSGDGVATEDGDGDESVETAPPPTYVVCRPDVAHVTLGTVHAVGDPRPEIALGCGAEVHVFAFSEGEEVAAPMRVLVLDASTSSGGRAPGQLFAGSIAGMDVDGDGLGDLVAPFHSVTPEGDTSGGALFLLRRDAMGAFESPVALAPIASLTVALAQLDGQPGFEILATNRGSDLARRPSEVWVFTGGAAPSRSAVLRASVGEVAVAVADLDRDGHEDAAVIAKRADHLRIHFGDGTARFARMAEVPLDDASEIVAGDVDGDGGDDVLVRAGGGLYLVAAGPQESLALRPIDAPTRLHSISLRDVDGDRKRDIVGIDGQRLVWLRQGEDLAFTEETLVTATGGTLLHYALADVNGDGAVDLVAVGRAEAPDAPWSLSVVANVREAEALTFEPAGASAPANAPLTLQVALR